MNSSASQCGTGGCESGWTCYLDQSSCSQTQCRNLGEDFDEDYGVIKGARFLVEDEDGGEEEEEEGLSMVSDASSGPIHYHVESCIGENGSFCCQHTTTEPAKETSKSKRKMKQQHSYLDDTASSPVISLKNLKEEASQGFSGTHFKGKSSIKKFGKTCSKHAGKKQGMTKG